MFSEKLNFLMEITKMQNNVLAAAVNLDASYISRLRHGTRKLSKNQTYLMPMAHYFSRQIKFDYQKNIIKDALSLKGEFPDNNEKLSKLLHDWLLDGISPNGTYVDSIIQGFSSANRKKNEIDFITIEKGTENKSYYYGTNGKREAVIRFLTEVANENIPQTLLLFSDEEMSWLYEDGTFAKKWAVLLKNILLQGNHIKIIHTVSRDLNELLEAVSKWIPIYATGAIEPFYYPKVRDGLFQRTLFIAPQTAAIVSTSVQQKTENMLNAYIEDKTAISALVEDFQNYIQLCRPLMHIYNISNISSFRKLYFDFIKAEGNFISLRNNLSLPTIPQSLINEIGNNNLSSIYQKVVESYSNTMKNFSFTEILTFPKSNETTVHSAMLGIEDIILTDEQHASHIMNVISLLKENPNYNVVLCDMIIPNTLILAKENVGVIMINLQAPYCSFAFNERNMVSVFWDYLSDIKKKFDNKNKTIELLEKSVYISL